MVLSDFFFPQIISNLESGKMEDGRAVNPAFSDFNSPASLAVWRQRELRVLYSLANCAIIQKDFSHALANLDIVLELEEDKAKRPKVHSALGRVYLQLGEKRRTK